MEINNKTVFITGGGSGIGLAIAQKFLLEGARVIICGRNEEKLAHAKKETPELHTEVCDVTNDEQIIGLMKKLQSDYGGVDILINNAGVFESIDYGAGSPSMSVQEKEIEIDFVGPIRMVNHFLPMLKAKKDAAIINVSSGLAFVPLASAPVYCATKAGLHAWTLSLRHQLRKTSVKIFELMPPLVKTEMVADFEGQQMMDPKILANACYKGVKNNDFEITPGQSSQLKMMSRLAPRFIFNAVNKQYA